MYMESKNRNIYILGNFVKKMLIKLKQENAKNW